MIADHGGKLKPVQFRHADVDQNDRYFVLEQVFQRFAAGGGDNEIFTELLENDLIGQKLGRLIVDQKDIYLFMVHHLLSPVSDAATCGWREAIALY